MNSRTVRMSSYEFIVDWNHLTESSWLLIWTHMNSHEHTWTHMNSNDLAWTHMNSQTVDWYQLTESSWLLIWTHISTHKLIWSHMNSYDLTWIHLNSHEHKLTHINSYEVMDCSYEPIWVHCGLVSVDWVFLTTDINSYEITWTQMSSHELIWSHGLFVWTRMSWL